MSRFDDWIESRTRDAAHRASRRGFLSALGAALFGGAAAIPLLPVARGAESARQPGPDESKLQGEQADPTSCNYWRYCGIDGFLSSCCGGTATMCPPGSELSRITWIGTCHNPGDGKDYVVSYNDCCGQSLCGRCLCTRTETERPVYQTFRNNDLLWCFDTESRAVYCSVSVVVGLATKS